MGKVDHSEVALYVLAVLYSALAIFAAARFVYKTVLLCRTSSSHRTVVTVTAAHHSAPGSPNTAGSDEFAAAQRQRKATAGVYLALCVLCCLAAYGISRTVVVVLGALDDIPTDGSLRSHFTTTVPALFLLTLQTSFIAKWVSHTLRPHPAAAAATPPDAHSLNTIPSGHMDGHHQALLTGGDTAPLPVPVIQSRPKHRSLGGPGIGLAPLHSAAPPHQADRSKTASDLTYHGGDDGSFEGTAEESHCCCTFALRALCCLGSAQCTAPAVIGRMAIGASVLCFFALGVVTGIAGVDCARGFPWLSSAFWNHAVAFTCGVAYATNGAVFLALGIYGFRQPLAPGAAGDLDDSVVAYLRKQKLRQFAVALVFGILSVARGVVLCAYIADTDSTKMHKVWHMSLAASLVLLVEWVCLVVTTVLLLLPDSPPSRQRGVMGVLGFREHQHGGNPGDAGLTTADIYHSADMHYDDVFTTPSHSYAAFQYDDDTMA